MIFSKVHFHSGAKRCIPCSVTWSKSRWVSHNFLVIVTLLTLCFHKSSSWGCLREPRRDLHLSSQPELLLTKKHSIFSSTHKHFSSKTHKKAYSEGHTGKGELTLKIMEIWSPNWIIVRPDPCAHPASGSCRGSVQGADHEIAHTKKLFINNIRPHFLRFSSKFPNTAKTEENWTFKLYIKI